MPSYKEQDIQNMIKFSDELFLQLRGKFGQVYKIDNIELIGATEYLAYVIYPYDAENRIRFYNSAIWLLIKTDTSIGKKEAKKHIKIMCGEHHNKLNFKNTEQNYVKASKTLLKRIQAVHSFELTLNLSNTFKENLSAVSLAYKDMYGKTIDINSPNYDPENQLDNAKKEILRPSRGVIHLTYGFIEAFFNNRPIEYRSIKSALQRPSWVNEAVKISEEHLKIRLLSNYYREKGVKTGTNLKLDLSEIILLTT